MNILEEMVVTEAPPLVALTVDQYHEMLAKGILRDGDPIELIDGILVRKDRARKGEDPMTHAPAHAVCVTLLQQQFGGIEDLGFHVRVQLPVTLGGTREPEPDLAVVRGRPEAYRDRHPGPNDIVLAIEVADSSLAFDRTTKKRLYASAAIPTYWILNLVDGQLEVYQEPQPASGDYAPRASYRPGHVVSLTLDPGVDVTFPLADVLP